METTPATVTVHPLEDQTSGNTRYQVIIDHDIIADEADTQEEADGIAAGIRWSLTSPTRRRFEQYVEAPLVELLDRYHTDGLRPHESARLTRLARKAAKAHGIDVADIYAGLIY